MIVERIDFVIRNERPNEEIVATLTDAKAEIERLRVCFAAML